MRISDWSSDVCSSDLLAILIGFTLPMTATQILWINLVLAVTLGLVLAFEPGEPGTMERRPRDANAPLLSPFLLWRVVLVSMLLAELRLRSEERRVGRECVSTC